MTFRQNAVLMPEATEEQLIEFPWSTEGLFYRLQLALGLMSLDWPQVARRVLAAIALAWLPLQRLWWWQSPAINAAGKPGTTASLLTHIAP